MKILFSAVDSANWWSFKTLSKVILFRLQFLHFSRRKFNPQMQLFLILTIKYFSKYCSSEFKKGLEEVFTQKEGSLKGNINYVKMCIIFKIVFAWFQNYLDKLKFRTIQLEFKISFEWLIADINISQQTKTTGFWQNGGDLPFLTSSEI